MFVELHIDAARSTMSLILGTSETRVRARLQLVLMPVLHHKLLLRAQLIQVLLSIYCREITIQTRLVGVSTKLGFSSLLNFKVYRK